MGAGGTLVGTLRIRAETRDRSEASLLGPGGGGGMGTGRWFSSRRVASVRGWLLRVTARIKVVISPTSLSMACPKRSNISRLPLASVGYRPGSVPTGTGLLRADRGPRRPKVVSRPRPSTPHKAPAKLKQAGHHPSVTQSPVGGHFPWANLVTTAGSTAFCKPLVCPKTPSPVGDEKFTRGR